MSASSEPAIGVLVSPKLDNLLRSYGIASEFIEFSGNIAHISATNRLHILNSMGINPASATEVATLLQQRELSGRLALLPPVYLLAQGHTAVQLNLPAGSVPALSWWLKLEDGKVRKGHTSPAPEFLQLGELPCGYHQLSVKQGEHSCDSLLIVAPGHCWQPPAVAAGKRLWGLSAQLYSVRSEQNWGIGDFADLLALVEQAGQQGADFILLNPLHYLDLRYPDNASPYSPSDRRYLNPLYIAAPLCEDFSALSVQSLFMDPANQQRLAALRATPLVDYAGLASFKLPILALMFRHFYSSEIPPTSERWLRFNAFCATGGSALQDFARMQAGNGIRTEAEFADPLFHLYLQWLAAEQLANCQQQAQTRMLLGLVRDLAVGSSGDGCEVQANPGLFCLKARIGAPPDHFTPLGQNWGLPPLLPDALVQQRFAHFIHLLQSNMSACGALRIDHVMSFMRLWWCPTDGTVAEGAYVHYPVDVLFAILRLESQRNSCLIIGEDLGVVPPEIRSFLDPAGVYSNCVFYYEKYDNWHFRKPEHYKPQALAMIANHDVPPLISWWSRNDLLLRRRFGLIPDDDTLQQDMAHRQGEKGQLLQWLAEQQLLPASWQHRNVELPLDPVLATALIEACGRSASRLLSLQLDDVASADAPVNIPGTSTEYPNWRRKLPRSLTELFADPAALSMLRVLAQERPR